MNFITMFFQMGIKCYTVDVKITQRSLLVVKNVYLE
jgi:hypothetical protein